MSVDKLKESYRFHDSLWCKQNSGLFFIDILKVEKSSGLDLKWMWQTLWTVYLKFNSNEGTTSAFKQPFTSTCILNQFKQKL